MKRFCLTSLVFSLLAAPLIAQNPVPGATAAPPPTTPKDQASYGIGMSVGASLKGQGLDAEIINPAMLARGIIDALAGAKPALTQEQLAAAMQQFEATMQAKQQRMQAQQQQLGAKAQTEGAAFLAKNAKAEGVKVLPSGLQYKVQKSGTGASPKATDTVRVHYHGTLINGEKFDSSVERGEPAEFPVNRVIAGWTEALQLMKVGDKWQLFIPSDLAYGPQGRPPQIPPHSVLVFDVELLDVK